MASLSYPVTAPPLHATPLSRPFLACSVLFAQFEGETYLLYGLGDGQLVNYRWGQRWGWEWGLAGWAGVFLPPSAHSVTTHCPPPTPLAVRAPPARRLTADGPADRKKIALGTKPIALRTFRSGGVERKSKKEGCCCCCCCACLAEAPTQGSLRHAVPCCTVPAPASPALDDSVPPQYSRLFLSAIHSTLLHSTPLHPPPPSNPSARATCCCCRSRGAAHVFAASDRPTVIYSANKKLLYSNLNENEVGGRVGGWGRAVSLGRRGGQGETVEAVGAGLGGL